MIKKTITKSYKSFGYVANGLKAVWTEQFFFKIEIFCAILVIVTAFYFNASFEEWVFSIISISMVLTAEIINTAIEELCNKIEPNQHPHIGKIKDISVTFVLVTMIAAFTITVLIFIHHFL